MRARPVESKLSPLDYSVKIVNSDGTPTPFLIQWLQQLRDEKGVTDELAANSLLLSEGTGSWVGYKFAENPDNIGKGVAFVNSVTGARAGIFVGDLDVGGIYCENIDGTEWLFIGGDLNANNRFPISGSHAFEFSDTPYVDNDPVATGAGSSHPWYWNPPLAAAFPTTVTEGSATGTSFTDDADLGLVISAAVGNNDNLYAKMQAPPAFPFTITAHFPHLTMNGGVPIAGVVLRASGTGLRTVFGADPVGGYQNFIIRRSTGTVFNATLGGFAPRAWGANGYWIRVVVTAANDIVYQMSADGKNWMTMQANTANGQVAGLNQIGFGFTSRNGANGIAYMACDHWTVA